MVYIKKNILPQLPYRQYVLSVPISLRYWMIQTGTEAAMPKALVVMVMTQRSF
jgi:hypothetical protein